MLINTEDVEKQIQETEARIAAFPKDESTFTKLQRRRRYVLTLKKQALTNLKLAREKHRWNDEIYNTSVIGMLEKYGDRHPLILYFLLNRLRWNIL